MNPEQLSTAVVDVLSTLQDEGCLVMAGGLPSAVPVTQPRRPGHGDYVSTAALQLAGAAGMDARTLADLLADHLLAIPGVADVQVEGPGFLNVTVQGGALGQVAVQVVQAGAGYGQPTDLPAGQLTTPVVPTSNVAADLSPVQYAHARACALLRYGADLGVPPWRESDPGLLQAPVEAELLAALADYPRIAQGAAESADDRVLARHLTGIGESLERWASDVSLRVLPMGDEPVSDLHRARLLLVDAIRIVLGNGLALLGAAAPERM